MTGEKEQIVKTQFYDHDQPFELGCGSFVEGMRLAYETYGELNPNKDNAILIFHALTGSQHAAGFNKSVDGAQDLWTEDCHLGWWNDFIVSSAKERNLNLLNNYSVTWAISLREFACLTQESLRR